MLSAVPDLLQALQVGTGGDLAAPPGDSASHTGALGTFFLKASKNTL